MQKFLKSDLSTVLLIILIFSVFLPFFYLHQGLLSVDTGREFYIPSQILSGQILYKDIFNIYGPFSYQFNAFLFGVFGQKISTLYNSGIVNSIFILITLYFISREFLNRKLSLIISLITMFSLVFNTFLYNSNITYSYAIIYALSSLLISVLFLIKFIKTNNTKFLYISCLFAGLSIINKYEFILQPLVILGVTILSKQLNIKQKLYCLLCFVFFPANSFIVLFLQGVTINDLKTAFNIMTIMANSESMKIFYSNYGNFFEPAKYIQLILKNPLYTIIGFLPIINIILTLVCLNHIIKNKKLLVFCLCSIAASFKFILFLNIEHMGLFLFPLCLLTTLVILENCFTINKIKYIILSALILFFAYNNFSSLQYKNYLLETNKGNIYTFRKDGEPIKKLSDFILLNTEKNDKIVILPEGLMVNFISDRKSDNIYYALSPLFYSDTFGEEKVINNYINNPADYIIILPLSTIEYGSENFYSYAGNFCEMINKNYNLIKEDNNIKIYKRKNK